MRTTKIVRLLAGIISFMLAQPAAASILVVDSSGQLTGAFDVDVNGTFYDVTFVGGACTDVYNGCDSVGDFDFSLQTDAVAAGNALLDQVFVDGSEGQFDSQPWLTLGCEEPSFCTSIIPYGTRSDPEYSVSTALVFNGDAGSGDFVIGNGILVPTIDISSGVFARFTPSANRPPAVPEPSTWAMLLVGFGAVGFMMRRKPIKPQAAKRKRTPLRCKAVGPAPSGSS